MRCILFQIRLIDAGRVIIVSKGFVRLAEQDRHVPVVPVRNLFQTGFRRVIVAGIERQAAFIVVAHRTPACLERFLNQFLPLFVITVLRKLLVDLHQAVIVFRIRFHGLLIIRHHPVRIFLRHQNRAAH